MLGFFFSTLVGAAMAVDPDQVCGQLVDSSLFLVLVRELVLVLLVTLPLVAVSFSMADGSLEVNKSTLEP